MNMPKSRLPKVAVIVATEGRSTIEATLNALAKQTILKEEYVVYVVENTTKPSLQNRIRKFSKYINLRYCTYPKHNKVLALNAVIISLNVEIVAFTDDDCIPAQNWVEKILETFNRFPDIPCVGGKFVLSGTVPSVPVAVRGLVGARPFTAKGVQCRPWEIAWGGNFAVKRTLFDKVGLFDQDFGPGAPVPSGDDTEWLLRVLEEGYAMRYEPTILVVHNPSWAIEDKAGDRARIYYMIPGAILVKHLLEGRWKALSLINPITYFLGTRRGLPTTFTVRLRTALHTIPYVLLGALRYIKLRMQQGKNAQAQSEIGAGHGVQASPAHVFEAHVSRTSRE